MNNFITGWIDIYKTLELWFYLVANKYNYLN